VIRDSEGEITRNAYGEVITNHGEAEYRFYDKFREPFPLYPGESVDGVENTKLEIIAKNQAYLIEATRAHKDENGVQR